MEKNLIRILDGKAFKLRIKGQVKIGDYTEDADFDAVSDLIVNFVRRGREAQEYAIDDSGRIVVENNGTLSRGIYGVELRGYYNGKPWRFYERDVFVIVDEYDESDSGIDEENVLTYDGTFDISFGGDGVSAAYVEEVVNTHNNNKNSHPSILARLAEKVDEEDFQDHVDTQEGINAELREGIAAAGKVDDVLVDGQSVLDPQTKTASITIPTITVEGETLIF